MFPEFAGCLWVGAIHLLVCALLLCGVGFVFRLWVWRNLGLDLGLILVAHGFVWCEFVV